MNVLLTIVVIVCAVALVVVLVGRRARVAEDGVAEFRRQLGALSPDASRPVIRPHTSSTPTEDREPEDGA